MRAATACASLSAAVASVREDLEAMARALFHSDTQSTPRPVHGALIVNLRNILEAMDAVAEAQPVRVQARPVVAMSGRSKSVA